tara:strand:- start:256 stop:945 length:690 start_codon:yes stop_codon:yes gene_type:complete
MNSKTTFIGLVAAVAVLSGAMGLSVTGAFSDLKVVDYAPLNSATGMLIGHVEIEARHADGELYDYRQFDNAVVDDGEQCILKMLFATTNGGGAAAGRGEYTSTENTAGNISACTGALTGAWDVIAIGTGTTAAAELDVKLVNEATTNGGDRGIATTKTWSNGSGSVTQIVLSKQFTASGGAIGDVTESGLFNSTTVAGSGMLARNVFAAVTINDGDSITITWTFVVGDA